MIADRKRLLLMFFILANAKGEVRAKDIAESIGVSIRTVKKDMEDFDLFAKASGSRIVSKRGLGYILEVTDPALFNPVKEQLDIRFGNIDYSKIEYVSRSRDIIRRLFSEEDYIKIDDIATELYLTRSSIKNDLIEVREILDSYKLKLHSKPRFGVKIVGDEMFQRLCMIELYEVHYDRAMTIFQYNRYLTFFEVADQERADIRRNFLKTMRESKCCVLDTLTQRVALYLILLRKRYKLGYRLSFTEGQANYLRGFTEYEIAKKILKNLEVFGGFNVDDNEVLALEFIILIWSDLTPQDNIKERFPKEYEQALEICVTAKKRINDRWNIDFSKISDFDEIMIPALIPIIFQILFQCSQYRIMGSFSNTNSIHTSPLSIAMANSTARSIEEACNCKLSDHCINMLAIRFYAILDRIQYQYKPRKLIVCSRNGKQASSVIRERLLRTFNPKHFSGIDIAEFYEVRGLNQAEYDAMILNLPEYTYRYDMPYIPVANTLNNQEIKQIYEKVMLNGYELFPLFKNLNFQPNFVFKDFKYESQEAFIHLLSFKVGKNSDSIKRLELYLSNLTDIYVHNRIGILIISTVMTDRNIFEIYQLSKVGYWGKKEVKTIVFLSINFNQNMQLLKFIENLTHELIIEPNHVETLIKSENLEDMVQIVKMSI